MANYKTLLVLEERIQFLALQLRDINYKQAKPKFCNLNELEDFSFKVGKSEDIYAIALNHYYGNSKKVVIPSFIGNIPITSIESCAFIGNKIVNHIILPEKLNIIEGHAFYGCTNLQDICFPESLTTIEYSAFQNCEKLTNITIPKGLIDIDSDSFYGCKNLKEFIVDKHNPVYTSCDGVLFDKNMTTLIMYPNGREGDYIIPESITTIVASAFDNCEKLTKIVLPESLLYIGDNVFCNCEQLSEITLPKNLLYIGKEAFMKCPNLKSITLLKNTKICYETFNGYSGQVIYRD